MIVLVAISKFLSRMVYHAMSRLFDLVLVFVVNVFGQCPVGKWQRPPATELDGKECPCYLAFSIIIRLMLTYMHVT